MRMIITADWHIRATRPRCRVDSDWIETQRKALNWVAGIAEEMKCPVMVVGDVFHSNSDTSFECISMVQKLADRLDELYVLAGNHDLPYHNSENLDKSAIGVLLRSDNIKRIKDYFENQDTLIQCSASNFDEPDNANAEFVFKHILTIPKEDKADFIECETPESLLEKFPKAKWIFTGDYHRNFHYEKNGRHVVNSGCLLRQVSDFKDYQCGVYYVDTDENVAEFVPIIDREELIDDSYITKESEREARISDFADKLKNVKSVSFDFVENVRNLMDGNGFSEELKGVVEELLEA